MVINLNGFLFFQANEEDMTSNQRHLTELVQIEEDDHQMSLFKSNRHVFVLTSNAKPVFSLLGDAYKWAPSMAAVVALLACFNDRNDNLKLVDFIVTILCIQYFIIELFENVSCNISTLFF